MATREEVFKATGGAMALKHRKTNTWWLLN